MDDRDDWLDSDWTEISDQDLKSSKTYLKKMAKIAMKGENDNFKGIIDSFLLQCEQIFSKYFDSTNLKDTKVEEFITLWGDTEELKGKLDEEKKDNQRLVRKLDSLDSELSSLLVNHIGNSISQEWDYVETSTDILKDKTNNCMNQAKIVQNSVEKLVYGENNKNILLKIKGKPNFSLKYRTFKEKTAW